MLIDLKGKVAIVTGAARGIGRVIADTFAAEGVKTVVTDISEENLAPVTEEFAAHNWEGRQVVCDVRDSAGVQALVDLVVTEYGRIDIVVNNAGVAPTAPVDQMTEEMWDANLDINLKGVFLMCKAVLPVMKRQRGGRILNAASFAAIVPSAGGSAYAASKAGVHYFTRTLAGEVGPWNITVNCYSPGMIPSQINHFTERPHEQQERLLDTLTLRRWGSEQEVANLLCFLASDLAGYITGTMVDVSGGKLATQIPRVPYEWAAAAGEYTFE
jgi:3-oxoacyl-[acyl-carrier protein] reductase